jgi:hypothetical protein
MLVTWLPSGCNRRLITPQKILKNKLKRTGILPPARAVSRHTSKALRPLEVEQTGGVAGKETEPRWIFQIASLSFSHVAPYVPNQRGKFID